MLGRWALLMSRGPVRLGIVRDESLDVSEMASSADQCSGATEGTEMMLA